VTARDRADGRNSPRPAATLPRMAQDTDTTPPRAPGIPTFGKRADDFGERRYRSFNLEVEGRRTPRGREERWEETFQCFMDVDGGMWVALGQARTDMETARAVVTFLGANLRDDDGASMDYVMPATPELADPDDPDSDWLRDSPTEEEVARAAEEGRDPEGEPLYLGWDYELYPRAELPKLDELRDGSSRRRFAFISDSRAIRYKYEALEEVANWLTEGMTGRPTRRPVPSGHGPQRTSRGRGGR
jgi:hypothetical protein